MTDSPLVSRRTVLATGSLTAVGGLLLAGCSSSSDKSAAANTSTASDAAGTSTAPASAASDASTSTAAATTAGSSAAGSAAGAAGTAVAKLTDVPVGGSASATLDGKPILLAQPTAGTVVGFSAICTHQGCTVKPDGLKLACPCHGSVYDATTGKVLQGPAPSPLAKLTVTVSGGSVLASPQS